MTPPESPPLPLAGARESSSSKKRTQGAAILACANTSLTLRSDSPTYISSSWHDRRRCPDRSCRHEGEVYVHYGRRYFPRGERWGGGTRDASCEGTRNGDEGRGGHSPQSRLLSHHGKPLPRQREGPLFFDGARAGCDAPTGSTPAPPSKGVPRDQAFGVGTGPSPRCATFEGTLSPTPGPSTGPGASSLARTPRAPGAKAAPPRCHAP